MWILYLLRNRETLVHQNTNTLTYAFSKWKTLGLELGLTKLPISLMDFKIGGLRKRKEYAYDIGDLHDVEMVQPLTHTIKCCTSLLNLN